MSIIARFRIERSDFLFDVDLRIPGSGITALYGRSGSGKTTCLRCIAGLERTRDGYLNVNGACWQDGRDRLPVHRRPLGVVFQEASLFPHLSVERNLRFGLQRVGSSEHRVDFDETVELLALSALLHRAPDALSGGQRQRVAIGRALLSSPELLLMDEPMASLDAASKAEILPYLERLHARLSIPVIYVSHQLAEVTRLADHMVLLDNGRVLAEGALSHLLARNDLPLAVDEDAVAVVDATVRNHDDTHQLTALTITHGTPLWVARMPHAIGTALRLRIPARDVALSLSEADTLSAANRLRARVLAINDDRLPGHVLIRLALDDHTTLLSRITARACRQLELTPGMTVYALVDLQTDQG